MDGNKCLICEELLDSDDSSDNICPQCKSSLQVIKIGTSIIITR